MTELRHWLEDGASDEELAAVQAARSMRPAPAARARNLAKVGVGGGAALAATSAKAASSLGLISKLFVGLLAVGGVSTLVWTVSRRAASTDAAVSVAAAPSSDEPAPGAPLEAAALSVSAELAPPSEPPAPADAPAPGPSPVAATPLRPRAPSASAGSLSEEVLALERANAALDAKSPEAALRELEQYQRRFPRGALSSEQVVMQVQALVQRGDPQSRQRAIALANQFAARHPSSPYAARVQALVRNLRKD
jgi:hypothetical protein